MPIKLTQITRLDRGINDDKLNLADGYFDYIENVVLGKRSAKQVQNSSPTTNTKGIIELIDIDDDVWGLGWDNETDKNVTLWNYKTNAWETPVTPSTSYALNVKLRPTLLYDGSDHIYYDNNTKLGKWSISGSGTRNGDFYASGGSELGIIWDGDIVVAVGQVIQRVTTAGAEGASITIPTGQTPVDFVDMGNYLGIICNGGTGSISKMFIWDGVNTTTFVSGVTIGKGYVTGGGLLEGVVTVVITSFNYKEITIKSYTGSIFQTNYIYNAKTNSKTPTAYTIISPIKVKIYDNYMYILCGGTVPLSTNIIETFLARYGRDTIYDYASFSIYKNFGFSPTNLGWPIPYGGFASYNIDGFDNLPMMASIYDTSDTMKLVMPSTAYTAQAGVLETGWYDGGYANLKGLVGAEAQFEPLITGQSVVVKYKKQADTSWTTYFTESTVGEVQRELLTALKYKKIKWRIELLGGATLNEFLFKYETQNSKLTPQ